MNDVRYLNDALERLARTETLLVACDFDGTLAPIVANPADAVPHRASIDSLRSLAGMADTHVVVISGRGLDDLADHLGPHRNIRLIGSHGAESQEGAAPLLSTDEHTLRKELERQLADLATKYPGANVEEKPLGAAFHVRNVNLDDQNAAMVEVLDGPGQLPGVYVTLGKKVVELSVVKTDKGTALRETKAALGATAMLFIGDDATDESGFKVMRDPDVSVKVGMGPTSASYSVSDVDAVAQLLAVVMDHRSVWTGDNTAEPIDRHSLLSDMKTLALVQSDATISWMGAPFADSPSLFGKLLGTEQHGHFSIGPEVKSPPLRQRYLTDSMVLETEWEGLTVTDFFHVNADLVDPRSTGRPSRLLRILEGRIPTVIEFAPRPNYAEHVPKMKVTSEGVELHDGDQHVRLVGRGIEWKILHREHGDVVRGHLNPHGSPLHLELQISETKKFPRPLEAVGKSLRETLDFWRAWIDALSFPSVATPHVRRSALVLKSLCHYASGSILAAGTTSLPEDIGGTRNWDYRMCWPRDGSMIAGALVSLGSLAEAEQFLNWLAERVTKLGGPEQMRPVYPLRGDVAPEERELSSLPGYRGSKPVRVGNGADAQVQMDVFGPIVALIADVTAAGQPLTDERWWLVTQMAEAVARRWNEPDFGIWEERRPTRQHVHSKVMCWQTLDRALKIAKHAGRTPEPHWAPLRDEIKTQVLAEGWNDEVRAYTIAYGDTGLDSAVLYLALSGLLDAHDPRFVATVEQIEKNLRFGPTVYRYALDDGFRESEGGFFICAAWLAQAYWLMGRVQDADTLFEQYVELIGPTGLLSEQYEPFQQISLGNVPQGYSHIGLINMAQAAESIKNLGPSPKES
jgi:trehalose 6-phosphate phosphatase